MLLRVSRRKLVGRIIVRGRRRLRLRLKIRRLIGVKVNVPLRVIRLMVIRLLIMVVGNGVFLLVLTWCSILGLLICRVSWKSLIVKVHLLGIGRWNRLGRIKKRLIIWLLRVGRPVRWTTCC